MPKTARVVTRSLLFLLILSLSVISGTQIGAKGAALQPHAPIVITGDSGFTSANGVVSGSGTASNPFIIEGWNISAGAPAQSAINLTNTAAFFIIQNVKLYASLAGIRLTNVRNGIVQNVNVTYSIDGILGLGVGHIQIINNQIGNSYGYGIYLYSSTNVSISGNTIIGSGFDGVLVGSSSRLNMTNNTIVTSKTGIAVGQSSHMILANNNITGTSETGMVIEGSSYLTLQKNLFSSSNGVFLYGPSLYQYDTNSISPDNLINGRPISFYKDCSNLSFPSYQGELILANCKNISITYLTVTGASLGLELAYDSSVSVAHANLYGDRYGVYVTSSSNITISSSILSQDQNGILIDNSTMAKLYSNTFTSDGVTITGTSLSNFNTHTITTDNIVNGRPLYYYKNQRALNIASTPVGELILANATRIVVSGLQVSNTETAILAAYVSRAIFTANSLSYNTQGILVQSAYNVTVSYNTLTSNQNGLAVYGTSLGDPSNRDLLTVANNTLSSNPNRGILIASSTNATVTGNTVRSTIGAPGISVTGTYGTKLTNNTLYRNEEGIHLGNDSYARVYRNWFIMNVGLQAMDNSFTATNMWDNGYPNGGNFWSDYKGPDLLHGPYQNITGSDGIGDTPYNVYCWPSCPATDRYPLAQEYRLMITPVTGGWTSPPPGNYTLPFGFTLSITAPPEYGIGWVDQLDHWELDGVSIGSANPLSLTTTTSTSIHKLAPFYTIHIIDTTPPSWPSPSSLSATVQGPVGVNLYWSMATDDVGVNSYEIFQNGTLVGTVAPPSTSFDVNGLKPHTTYLFKVEACDAAGYCSTNGPASTATTGALPPPCSCPALNLWPILLVVAIVLFVVSVALVLVRARVRREKMIGQEFPSGGTGLMGVSFTSRLTLLVFTRGAMS